MKKFILKYWFVLPILLALFMLILLVLLLQYTVNQSSTVFTNIVSVILLLIFIALPVSWVILAKNKKWGKVAISFGASLVIFCVFGIPIFLSSLFAPDNDDFGKNHPICVGMKYNLPLAGYSVDTTGCRSYYTYYDEALDSIAPVDSLDADTYLSVRNSYQGGIYTYDFYYGPLPAGEIFLRCFEVTENIPLSDYWLSKSNIDKCSRVKINQTTSFSKLVDEQSFTIYEGDWGDYYLARIEVWFRDAETKEEKKLAEKVYRVEGWMR